MEKDLEEQLNRIREVCQEVREANQAREDALWESLTPDQKLDIFCAVVRRIHQAEIQDRGSYRYALYNVFGFDLDAYTRGMDCGYMSIHNAIVVDKNEEH